MIPKTSVDRFKSLLQEKGFKYTYERKTIFEETANLKGHFDADSLYEHFKVKGIRVSRDTVYRTLPLLLESKVIQKSAGQGKREFFERIGTKGHHDHMVCVQCGKIIEFQCPEIEQMQDRVSAQHGFKLTFHDHRLFGVCQNCQHH